MTKQIVEILRTKAKKLLLQFCPDETKLFRANVQ